MTPIIGIPCFAIILVAWFGGVRYQGHSGGPRRHRRRHADRLGLDAGRAQLRRHDPAEGEPGRRQLRLLLSQSEHRALRRVRVPRHHPGHRHSLRHLDGSGRGDGQRRRAAEAAGPTRSPPRKCSPRRRGEPGRLPDGQPLHQRGLHRPSRLEGDGRPDRLFRRTRPGDRAVVAASSRWCSPCCPWSPSRRSCSTSAC